MDGKRKQKQKPVQHAADKPEEKPAACGTACGAADKLEEKPAACGTACGASDK